MILVRGPSRGPQPRKRNAPKPKRSQAQPIRTPFGYAPSLAPDVKAYLRCLADPFDAPPAPIPYGPSHATTVYKNYGKFFATSSGGGSIVWAAFAPYFGNDAYAGFYSQAGFNGSTIPDLTPVSGEVGAITMSGSPYSFGDFQPGSGVGAGIHARCISAGIRVTCVNPQIQVGGYGIIGFTAFSTPAPVTGQDGLGPSFTGLASQGLQKDLVMTAPNTYVWSPLNMEDLDYPDIGFWSPPSTLASEWVSVDQNFSYAQTYPLFFAIQGPPSTTSTFMVEVVTNFQVMGYDARNQSLPPSSLPPVRHVAALANAGAAVRHAITASPHAAAIAHKPSFFKRIGEGIKRFGSDLLHDGANVLQSAAGTFLGNSAKGFLSRSLGSADRAVFGNIPSSTTVEALEDGGLLLM